MRTPRGIWLGLAVLGGCRGIDEQALDAALREVEAVEGAQARAEAARRGLSAFLEDAGQAQLATEVAEGAGAGELAGLEPELRELARAACGGREPPGLAGARAAARTRFLEVCAPPEALTGGAMPVVWGAGDPALALVVGAWLGGQGVSPALAERAGRLLTGASLLEVEPAGLPRFASPTGPAPPRPSHELDGSGLRGPGGSSVEAMDGALASPLDPSADGWPLAGVSPAGAVSLAVGEGASAESLARVAATFGSIGVFGVATLGGLDDRPGLLALAPAPPAWPTASVTAGGVAVLRGGDLLPPVPGCPAPGPTLCGPDPIADLAAWAGSEGVAELGLSLAPGASATELVSAVDRLAVAGIRAGPARRFLPCGPAVPGMVCVPGGPALVGGPDTPELPARMVVLSTFWIDAEEVRADDFRRCVDAGFCAPPAGPAGAPGAAVSGVAWRDAQRHCGWNGLRLPTEWEWEKAARVDLGVRDALAGVAEWTDSWVEPASCGPLCAGVDPLGFCQGTHPCRGADRKVVRGAASRRGGERTATVRQPTAVAAGPGVGVRCATSVPWRTAWPPVQIAEPWPPPPVPEAPPPERAALARDLVRDDLDDKGICGEDVRKGWKEDLRNGGRSTTECRDPYSYVTTNESRAHTFAPFVRNIGGAYVGIGSTQNYDLIAAARSEWAWVVDYDPNVVRVHLVDQALVLASPTRQEFVARWAPEALEESRRIVAEHHAADPDASTYVAMLSGYRGRLYEHYQQGLDGWPEDPGFGWLGTDDGYQTIRRLYQQGRLVPVGGDLLATGTMRSIGARARDLGVPVRIYYTSNAPTAWGGQVTPEYRANVAALPFDERSVVLATYNKGGFAQKDWWHYSVADARLLQRRLSLDAYDTMWRLVWDRIPTPDGDVTVCGLRGGAPLVPPHPPR